jgi:hypothetical protein
MFERSYIDAYVKPSLEDLKRHLRITSGDLDETLHPCLLAAINSAEHHIGKIIARSEFTYSGFFIRSLDLRGPGIVVKSVEVDGKTLGIEDYDLDGRTLLISPNVIGKEMQMVYESGMQFVDFDIKAAILLTAAKLFNNPADTVEAMPSVAKNLLRPHRSFGIDG